MVTINQLWIAHFGFTDRGNIIHYKTNRIVTESIDMILNFAWTAFSLLARVLYRKNFVAFFGMEHTAMTQSPKWSGYRKAGNVTKITICNVYVRGAFTFLLCCLKKNKTNTKTNQMNGKKGKTKEIGIYKMKIAFCLTVELQFCIIYSWCWLHF